jgi:hypothetical protein
MSSKKVKYLGINLLKEIKELFNTMEERNQGRLQKMKRSPMLLY